MKKMTNRAHNAHLTENDIADYLAGSMPRERRDRAAAHMASCTDCLTAVVSTYESVGPKENKKRSIRSIMKDILKKFNPYLALAVVSFLFSFVTPRYFIQLLVATLLLGIKWIVDSKTTRMLVMIYEAWKHGGEKEASKVLERIGQSETVRF